MISHLLQSEDWEKYQHLEGKKTFRLTDDCFDCLVTEQSTPFGNYIYLPYGPNLKVSEDNSLLLAQAQQDFDKKAHTQAKKSLQKALKSLQELSKTESAYFIRLEPTFPFTASELAEIAKKAGLKLKASHELDPAHSWAIDLTQTEEEILSQMESRKVRYWRNHEKKGMKIRSTTDPEEITILSSLMRGLGEKNKFIPQTEQHLKNQLKAGVATLYVVDYTDPEKNQTEPIAAALIYDYAGVRYYAHAATDDAHRKFNAGSILLIQMILDAKTNGSTIYDFWGITTSEDKNHPWYFFTQYKKSFGGYQIDYSGTYDFIIKPAKYNLYQSIRKINRLRRKITKH